jgi:DNA-binding transcriptional LysR family regulator
MNSLIDLRQFRYFIAVAEELHFGRAALRLHMEQPPLSQQIQRMEKTLGCRLFERKPKVALTEAGKTLLTVARRTISQVNQGIELTRQVGLGEAGSLSIGFAASAMLGSLPEIIRTYREQFPEVVLNLVELSPGEETKSILEGQVDIGFIRERVSSESLSFEIINKEHFGVLLPVNHRFAANSVLLPEALANESFVHFPRHISPSLFEQISAICRNAGFSPHVIQEAREWLTIIGLVESGLGIAIVPASVGRIKLAGITFVPLRSPVKSVITLSYLHESLKPTTAAFINIAKQAANLV